VTLEGGGLVSLPRAADPQLFTDPVSLSFEDLTVTRAAASRGLLVRLTDAGGGAGTWQVQLAPQAATAGASIDIPGVITVSPGGEADVAVVARAAADAPQGENYGFVVLQRGDITRRIPYFFLVDRPALADAPVLALERQQSGDTREGADRVDAYRYPVRTVRQRARHGADGRGRCRDPVPDVHRSSGRERGRVRDHGDGRRAGRPVLSRRTR